MPLLTTLVLLLCILWQSPAAALPPDAWRDAAVLPDLADLLAPAPPALLGQALAGRWQGTLHYRDYGNDKGVTLPTSLVVDGPSNALRLAFIYDDGPGKTVRSTEQWALGADGATLQMGKDDVPMRVSVYRSKDNADVALVALGTGVENGVPVELRSVILRRGQALSFSKASRLPQQAWLLRHVYRFTPQP